MAATGGLITTSTLLSRGKTAPRTVIGSVSALEFLVAASASLGFVVGLGEDFINNLPVVMGLAAGGNLVAPVAAWLVSQISPVMVGNVVGGLIVLTNSQKLVTHFGVEWPWSTFVARGPRVAGVSRARVRTRGAGEPDPVAEPEKSTR